MRSPFFVVIAGLIGLSAITAIAQPEKAAKAAAKQPAPMKAGLLEFTPFHKPRELLGDPLAFASDEARTLFEHVVRNAQGTSPAFGGMLMEGGEYAAVGQGCYLVMYAAIQFTCLPSPEVRELTPWNAPGNTAIVSVHGLPGGRWWALVETGGLSRGIQTRSFHALLGTPRAGRIDVTAKPLAHSSVPDGDDAACNAEPAIASHAIERRQDGAVVVFRMKRAGCGSARARTFSRRYAIP